MNNLQEKMCPIITTKRRKSDFQEKPRKLAVILTNLCKGHKEASVTASAVVHSVRILRDTLS